MMQHSHNVAWPEVLRIDAVSSPTVHICSVAQAKPKVKMPKVTIATIATICFS